MTDATNDTNTSETTIEATETMTTTRLQAQIIKRQIIVRATEIYTNFIQFISSLPRSPAAQDDVTVALEYLDLGFITLQRSVMKLPCEAIQFPLAQVAPQPEAATQPTVEATTETAPEASTPQVETPLDAA